MHLVRPDLCQREKHVAKVNPKNSTAVFRSLEAKFVKLHPPRDHKTKEATAKAEARVAKVEAQIKKICDLANSAEPGFGDFGERFILLLRKQWRSSQDWIDYGQERNRLLVRLGEVSAEEHKRASEEARRQRAGFISDRNWKMAQKFLNKKSNSYKSDSALKAEIGKLHSLGRSASIEAINRGLKALKT